MNMLDASEGYRVFRKPLYVDASGRTILADADGPGYAVVSDHCPTIPFRDHIVWQGKEGLVRIALGRTKPPEGPAEAFSNQYRGCGWVVRSEGPTIVDDGTQLFGTINPRVPVPVFRRVWCPGEMEVIPCPQINCELIDRWSVCDPEAARERDVVVQGRSRVMELSSTWPNDEPFTDLNQSFLNAVSWVQQVPQDCLGLRILRSFDQFHGRQRARVLVDDDFVGWWYDPAEHRRHRWNRSEIGISARFLKDKSQVTITLDPPAGVALWNMGELRVYAVFAD